ncbi:hypothetical protein FQA39_LY12798 [Lamprigera yunnana]|nr:hypothetical protein FQA39_LY12798 [Lamprigera yunnana]
MKKLIFKFLKVFAQVLQVEIAITEQFGRKNKLDIGDVINLNDNLFMITAYATDAYSFYAAADPDVPLPNGKNGTNLPYDASIAIGPNSDKFDSLVINDPHLFMSEATKGMYNGNSIYKGEKLFVFKDEPVSYKNKEITDVQFKIVDVAEIYGSDLMLIDSDIANSLLGMSNARVTPYTDQMFIPNDQDVENVEEVVNKYNALLAENGKIIETNNLGLLNFAYPINHKKKGHYVVTIVETVTASIQEFERLAGIDKAIVLILSKTDMTKFEEERREKRNFKKPFVKPQTQQTVKPEVKETKPAEIKE